MTYVPCSLYCPQLRPPLHEPRAQSERSSLKRPATKSFTSRERKASGPPRSVIPAQAGIQHGCPIHRAAMGGVPMTYVPSYCPPVLPAIRFHAVRWA